MSKRNNGEGTKPQQLSSGNWNAVVMLGFKPDGKRLRKSVTRATANEVRRAVTELVRAYEQGQQPTIGAGMTLSEWMAEYFAYCQKNETVRTRTLEGYLGYTNRYVDTTRLGQHRLNKLKPYDFEQQYQAMRANGLSVPTVRQLHAIVRSALDHAVRTGIIGHNPATLAAIPQLSKKQERGQTSDTLTVTEARTLLDAAEHTDNPARWSLGLLLGLRQSEVLALTWDAVNLDTGTISVERALYRLTWQHGCHDDVTDKPTCTGKRGADCPQRHSGGLHVGDPKSLSSLRTIPLPAELIQALRDQHTKHTLWAVQDGHHATWTTPAGETLDLVFKQRNGRPTNPKTDWQEFKTLLADAGLKPIRVHDLRHTAATLLLVKKVDPRTVMAIMGWSQISMLARYQHVLDELQREAITAVTDSVFNTNPTPQPSNVIGLHAWKQRKHA